MAALAFFALFGALFAALPLMMAAEARMRKGTWKPHRSGTGLVWFESDHGRLALDHSGHVRFQARNAPERVVPLADVRGIRFTHVQHADPAALAEFDAFVGYRSGLTDVLDRYELTLATTSGDIPVFIAGQVFRRIIGITWLTDALTNLASRWGLVPDVESYAAAAARELQDEFARRGHPIRLV